MVLLGHEICPGMLSPKNLLVHETHFSAAPLGAESQPILTEISQVTWANHRGIACAKAASPQLCCHNGHFK